MKVGVTATQVGMSDAQRSMLRMFLIALGATQLHHGDCIGGDAQADAIARALGIAVAIHPPLDPSKRAFCAQEGDVVWRPQPYLIRNHEIVDAIDVLVAGPRSDVEELRSGTWATVRYARKVGRRVVVLPHSWPRE